MAFASERSIKREMMRHAGIPLSRRHRRFNKAETKRQMLKLEREEKEAAAKQRAAQHTHAPVPSVKQPGLLRRLLHRITGRGR